MRSALLGCMALSVSAAPVGVFLMLRRMSLTGDAMAHAILPGAAIGYLIAGLSLSAMTIGGIVAGLTVAVGSGLVARNTVLREDTSLAAFYLLSLALGVLIVSVRGNSVDLLHVLFGTVLALDNAALTLLGGITAVTLVSLRVLYRPLVLDCLDPGFLRGAQPLEPGGALRLSGAAGDQPRGRFPRPGHADGRGHHGAARRHRALLGAPPRPPAADLATALALLASVGGLLISYHADWPTSPVIVLSLGSAYLLSLVFGPHGLLRHQRPASLHLQA